MAPCDERVSAKLGQAAKAGVVKLSRAQATVFTGVRDLFKAVYRLTHRGPRVCSVRGGEKIPDSKRAARRQIVLSRQVDAFVLGELAPRCPRLSDCSSRSDGMLAVYPGDGSRISVDL